VTFESILIANRGEIACRVIRTARALGYRTVAVFSDADAEALHVQQADAAVHIGAAPAAESYLNAVAIIEAAKRSGADAIHPGYGFLSENATFAQACLDAGLVFIGPPPEAIRAMGDKAQAKRRMHDAGVPCAPGYLGDAQDLLDRADVARVVRALGAAGPRLRAAAHEQRLGRALPVRDAAVPLLRQQRVALRQEAAHR